MCVVVNSQPPLDRDTRPSSLVPIMWHVAASRISRGVASRISRVLFPSKLQAV